MARLVGPAFPGAHGRLVLRRESVAGDHAQVDLFTVRPDGLGLRLLTATPDLNELGPARLRLPGSAESSPDWQLVH